MDKKTIYIDFIILFQMMVEEKNYSAIYFRSSKQTFHVQLNREFVKISNVASCMKKCRTKSFDF